jgi:hypothetical protein
VNGRPRTGTAGSPAAAGAAYFGIVFALGFVLGTMRTLVVEEAPGTGRLLGVLIELPIMLVASWLACRHLVGRFGVAATVGARAVMGAVALALLLLAEMLVGALLFGRTAAAHVALYREASYAVGLAAQVAFALMPLARLRWDR